MSRPGWHALPLIWLGGALGTAARAGLGAWLPAGWMSAPTLLANVGGAFLIGLLYQWLILRAADGEPRRDLRLFVGTGFLGGFTTYSALAVQSALHGWAGLAWALVSVAAGIAACALGFGLAVRATRRPPVEGEAARGEAA